MRIEYSKQASKYISALDRPTKQRIKAGIEGTDRRTAEG
jgi:mRNA interferase RelE/StbE